MMQQEKRDSHGSNIKLNVPEDDNKMRFIHNAGKDSVNKAGGLNPADQGVTVETVYSQVFVTAPNTFTGDVVWVTETTPFASEATSVSLDAAQASYLSAKSAANQPHTYTTSVAKGSPLAQTGYSTAKGVPPQFTRSATADAGVVGGTPIHSSHDPTMVGGSPLSASRTSQPDDLIAQKGHAMSGGAKAGVAFGVIAAIALCAGLLFFCWRRRKNQLNDGHEQLDEKHVSKNSFFGGTAAAVGAPAGDRSSMKSEKSLRSSRTASTAPRLSLRPVTQFLPNIMESRKSSGNTLNAPAMSEKPRSAWERRPQNSDQNPFTDAAMLSEKQARPESPPSNPFDEGDGAVVAGTKQQVTPTHSAKNSWEGAEMGTPKSAQVGTASTVTMTAAGAAGPRGPNNVHRVQLEFKPSMDDELELQSGQLVRMLHAYDDGWVS